MVVTGSDVNKAATPKAMNDLQGQGQGHDLQGHGHNPQSQGENQDYVIKCHSSHLIKA